MEAKDFKPKFSPFSEKKTLSEPGQTLLSSGEARWSSILLQIVRSPNTVESFETTATPDHRVVLVLDGMCDIESTSSHGLHKAHYRPGYGGMTAAMNTRRLRWSSQSQKALKFLHFYLPQVYFDEAAEEYRRAGQRTRISFPDLLGFADPIIFSVATSLVQGVRDGSPDLHADAGARFLATHLLCKVHRQWDFRSEYRQDFELTDKRLLRVLDFMREHFAESISIKQLAREAAISPFHFSRLFKTKVGMTPYCYLVHLRVKHAKNLLVNTDLSVFEIATACGYVHAGHFASAFRKHVSQTPVSYRKSHRISQEMLPLTVH